jgi:hypothetical protein
MEAKRKMRLRRLDLDAVLFALFKLLEETPVRTTRYVVLRSLFRRLGNRSQGLDPFTIEVDPSPEKPGAMGPDYQRIVDAVRARRGSGRGL